MLISDIKKSITQLKQLDILESAVHDAEKKSKNDSDFSKLVTEFSFAMEKLSSANKELDFTISDETVQYAEEAISQLESVISTGMVDEEELSVAKQQINKKFMQGLAKEWKTFYQQRTSGIAGKLATIGSLASDQAKISTIKMNISKGNEWTGLLVKDIQLLKNGIDELDQIEENLELSGEIKDFVVLVAKGKAGVTDLSSKIIEWIKKENLEDKFVVNFKSL